MFWVPCCDVRYDFDIKTMCGSSLPPVVCRGCMSYLRYLCLFVYSASIKCCVVFLRVAYPNGLRCQFLWIVHFWLPLQYSLTFIYNFRSVEYFFFFFRFLCFFLDVYIFIMALYSERLYLQFTMFSSFVVYNITETAILVLLLLYRINIQSCCTVNF